MRVLRSLVFAAALSGLIAGVVVSALQLFGTVPLIAKSETFETAAPAGHHNGDGHDHGSGGGEAWEPRPGLERNALTALFNIVERIGFGLLLAGALVASGRPLTWREGLLWGLAGFVTFMLAPGIGLPPELPGSPRAPLGPRQLWWIATAVCTAAGLWAILFRPSAVAAALGLALLVAPHLVGAPQGAGASSVPPDLARRFVTAVMVTTLLSWALLGALTGYLTGRFMAGPEETGLEARSAPPRVA